MLSYGAIVSEFKFFVFSSCFNVDDLFIASSSVCIGDPVPSFTLMKPVMVQGGVWYSRPVMATYDP
jgi:hypothetical protein